MATATYRIGPSDFFTGGDLKADADTLNGQVLAIDAQVEGNDAIDSGTLDQWTAWLAQWQSFYSSDFGGFFTNFFTALNDANRDQLIQYENTFANFAAQFASAGAAIAGGVVAPSTGSKDTVGAQVAQEAAGASGLLPSTTTIIVVLGLLAVVLFFWKSK